MASDLGARCNGATMRVPVLLILAAAVYVVLRCLLLATRPDTVAMPVYELATIGNLAAVTASGEGTAPLASYYDNCGGHLITGLLGAASYRVFGESYLALKLVPFALGLVALVLAWRIADRCFGRGAAAVTAFAFALPPPTLFKYSLLAKGNHFENVAFQLIVVWLVLGLSASRARRTRLCAAGVAAGFAVFLYFGSALMLVALCAAHVVAVSVRRAVRDVPLAALGCAFGLAPLAWIERATAGRASAFAEAKLGGEAGLFDGFGARLAAFLGDVAPNAGAFEAFAGLPASYAERAYLAAFVVAWCCALVALLRRSEGEPAARAAFAPFVLYPLLFLVAVGASTFDFDVYAKPVEVGRYRYLVPHFAFATILFGAALAWAWRRRGAWRLGAGALGTACFGASLFTLATIDWSFAETGVIEGYAGSWFRYYPNVALQPTFDAPRGEPTWDPAVLPANVARLSPPHRRDVYEGVGQREAQLRLVDPANEFDVAWLDPMLARYDSAHSL
ncbi:MAG: glycosyltransferase family 39 protein, partial [Planctomycetes bacterium]|nr:glycosyltransferase family 39 protein [Planctomycetota bacterium]